MRYSWEFKLKCVELYRQGVWQETPQGVKSKTFRKTIYRWHLIESEHGILGLKPKARYQEWSAENKLVVVMVNYSQVSRHKKAKIFRNRSIILPPV